jgi:tRNA A37 threonylcarbamoyladenosine dehydratase
VTGGEERGARSEELPCTGGADLIQAAGCVQVLDAPFAADTRDHPLKQRPKIGVDIRCVFARQSPVEPWQVQGWVMSECEKNHTSTAAAPATFEPKSKTSVQLSMRATTAAVKSDGD